MKSKILFSTLIMAAALSACTQEDLVVNNENASMEAVGAKLLASGISINSGEGVDSRVVVENGVPAFTKGDMAAVAWAVNASGKVADEQKAEYLTSLSPTLYANHMLVHDGSKFESRGNIYEGWHFAYRPFQYMPRPAQLEVVVNDSTSLVEADLDIDWYLNGSMFSNALFLSDENVDVENGKVEASMPLYFVHNTIRPELNVSPEFTKDPNNLLQKIAITGITLNAGKDNKLFIEKFKVQPKSFNDITALKENENIDETYFGEKKAFVPVTTDSMVVTTIKNTETYNLGNEKNTVRMFLAPVQKVENLSVEDLSFRIDVAGGHFDVVYTAEVDEEGKEVELSDTQKANNAALRKLYYRLIGEKDETYNPSARDLSKLWIEKDGKKQQTPYQTIAMSLALENFHADYLIKDIAAWNGCVDLANALAQEGVKPTFVLEAGKEIVFPAGEIKVPENGVNITTTNGNVGARMVFAESTVWNNKIGTVGGGTGLVVKNGGSLTVNKSVAATNFTVEDGGVIYAGANASLNTHNGQGVVNNGRIVVEYGANLNLKNVGTVAYVVTGDESIAQIEALIATEGNTSGRHAKVNTFVINEGIEWNMLKTETVNGSEDVYNPSDDKTPGYKDGVLGEISFEINGGKVYAAEDKVVSVKSVTMNGGSLEYVNLTGTLTVEAGTNTIISESVEGAATIKAGETTATGTTFASDVTVDGGKLTLVNCEIGGKLTNKGTVVLNSESAMNIGTLENNATLTSNNDINVTSVQLTAKSVTTLSSNGEDYNKTIWYSDSYEFKNMTLNGTVAQYTVQNFLAAIENAEDGDVVVLRNAAIIETGIQINKNIIIDLGGQTITPSRNFTFTDSKDLGLISVVDGATVTIKNGILDASGFNGGIAAVSVNKGTVIIEEGTTCKVSDDGNERNDLIYVRDDNQGNKCIINGGQFEYTGSCGKGWLYTLNTNNTNRTQYVFTVNGGTFYQFIPGITNPDGWNYEVQLGTGKNVYKNEETTPTSDTTPESSAWYTVK